MTRGRTLVLVGLLIAAAVGAWRLLRRDEPRIDDDEAAISAASGELPAPAVLPTPLAPGGDAAKPPPGRDAPRNPKARGTKPVGAPEKPNAVRLAVQLPAGVTPRGAEVVVWRWTLPAGVE